jgi:hypothetical protein
VRRLAWWVLLVVGSSGCVEACREDFEAHYPDVAAARRDGALDRGWLPEFLPPDAIDISEEHNIDTNVTWGCFSIPAGPAGLRQELQAHGASRIAGPLGRGPRNLVGAPDWWPRSMEEPGAEVYDVHESSRFKLRIGIDPAGRRVCFHRSGTG